MGCSTYMMGTCLGMTSYVYLVVPFADCLYMKLMEVD